MIIGIDYTAAVWQGAGIGRYTRELVRSAVAMGGRFRYVLFYAAGGLPPDSPYRADLRRLCDDFPQVRQVALPLSPRLLTIIWQRLRLPLAIEHFTGALDVLHAPDFVLPPTRARTLLTIHDLTFLTYPDCFYPSLQRYLRRAVPRNLRRAHLVLADSQSTRRDLVRLLGVVPERVVVVYPGVSPRFQPLPAAVCEAVRERLGLPPAFLLFVGTLEPRKNLVRLLEAFSHLVETTSGEAAQLALVIAGRKGWLYEDIFATLARLRLQSRVVFLDFVDDADLPALYNLARLFIYPSLYEGFGLPVVEALACGTPVVTSHAASLPEVAGDAALMVDPLDSRAIAHGIMQALEHSAELRAAGPRFAQRFCWEQSGRALLACYLAARDGGTA
jgi:glycosyltransferase involved in cell wall biosynthesis